MKITCDLCGKAYRVPENVVGDIFTCADMVDFFADGEDDEGLIDACKQRQSEKGENKA